MTQTLLKVTADFETSLLVSVNETDTTATLTSADDTDGIPLADGLWGFTIDNNTPQKEYIVATLTGDELTAIFNISEQGVATSGFSRFHRKGAVVEVTDWAALLRVVNILNGTTNLDGGTPLAYDSTPALGSSNQLATVQYVLDHVNGGAVSFNAEVIAGMAGETLTTGQWVYLKEADGRWYKTAANDITKCLGVRIGKALGAGTAGNSISGGVFIHGLETSGTYNAFTTYYLSDTPGAVATSAGTNSIIAGISDGNSKLIVGQTPGSYRDAFAGSVGTPNAANLFLTQQAEFTNIDQSQLTQNTTAGVGEANATTKKNKLAQSFIPTLKKIRGVSLYKSADTGTFTGTVTVALQADSAGSPSGSTLVSITIPNATWLLIPVGEFTADFSAEYASLTLESLYWMVLSTSTADNSNHPNLGLNTAGGYTNGSPKYNNTTDGWVAIAGQDLYFKTLGGRVSQIAYSDSTGVVPVSILPSSLIEVSTSATTLGNSNTETTVYTKQLPGTAIRASSGIHIKGIGTTQQSTTSLTTNVKVKLNGTTLVTFPFLLPNDAAPTMILEWEVWIFNTSTSAQVYLAVGNCFVNAYTIGAGNLTAGIVTQNSTGTGTTDVSGGAILTVTYQNGNTAAGTIFVHQGLVLEKIGT